MGTNFYVHKNNLTQSRKDAKVQARETREKGQKEDNLKVELRTEYAVSFSESPLAALREMVLASPGWVFGQSFQPVQRPAFRRKTKRLKPAL